MVRSAVTRLSPWSSLMATIPLVRALVKSEIGTFFTTPWRVAMSTNRSSVKLRKAHDRGDLFLAAQGEQDLDALALCLSAALRNLVHLHPVGLALVGDEQHVVVRGGDEELLDEIVLLQKRGGGALPAPSLPAIRGDGNPLDVAAVGDEDDHVLFRDQVLDVDLFRFLFDDLGPPVISELRGDLLRLRLYHAQDLLLA